MVEEGEEEKKRERLGNEYCSPTKHVYRELKT